MRTRSRDKFRFSEDRVLTLTPPGTVSRIAITSAYQTETMTDEVNKDFARRSRNGEVLFSPCSYTSSRRIGYGPGKIVELQNTTSRTLTEVVPSGITNRWLAEASGSSNPIRPTGGSDSGLMLSAQSQCLAEVDPAPYAMLEDVFEIRQTLGFIQKPLGALDDLNKAMLKDVNKLMKKKKSYSTVKAVGDVYLTYRFAYSPLVQSINNLIDGYCSTPPRPTRRTARGKAKNVWSDIVGRATKDNRFFYSRETEVTRDYRATIVYEHSNPVQDWKWKYGLRFKDIPETLWAVFPLSFMYDRVFNVSDVIRGLTNLADPNLKFLMCCTSKRQTSEHRWALVGHQRASYTLISLDPGRAEESFFSYTREKWTPNVLDTIPGINLGNLVSTSTKIADLTAIIAQSLLTGKR